MKFARLLPVVVLTFLLFGGAACADTEINSVLECSALTKNPPKFPKFSATITFVLSGNSLKADRILYKRPGRESYVGTIGPNNAVKITGHGVFDDNKSVTWHTTLSGSISTNAMTSVKGGLEADLGGHRDCTLTFMMPPDQFAALVKSRGATLTQTEVKPQADADKPQATTPKTSAAEATTTEDFHAASASQSHAVDKRVALVIGNSSYQNVPTLRNPERDAVTVAKALETVGFQTVTLQVNLGHEQLVNALRAFAKQAENADWAVVYYAGHGMEVAGVNYLIPTDASIASDLDIGLEAIPIDQVLNAAERAGALRLVILDACRDNPFANKMKRTVASRSVGRGLARIEPDPGTLVVYAAKHGETALDGDGENSPFVTAFVKDLRVPGVEVRRLFDNVRDDVMGMTGRRQQPYSYGSVPGRQDFYFVPK